MDVLKPVGKSQRTNTIFNEVSISIFHITQCNQWQHPCSVNFISLPGVITMLLASRIISTALSRLISVCVPEISIGFPPAVEDVP